MDCPFCTETRRDLFGLSLHVEDSHPGATAVVCAGSALPIVEVDIDAIYTNRPDLVRPGGHALQQ